MKKSAYIHIGVPKTGTTAIQSTLRRFYKRGKLNKFNMLYNPSNLSNLARDYRSTGDGKYFIEQIHEGILKHNSKLGEKNIIYSHEGTTTVHYNNEWGFRYDLLPLLATALKDYDIKVIVYIRRQDSFIESLVNAHVTTARNISYDNANFDYKELIDNCLENFEGIIVRKYDRESLFQNDVVTDFLHIVGLDELINDYVKNKGKVINPTPSPRLFRIARADNQRYILNEEDIKLKLEEIESQYKNGLISRRTHADLVFFCSLGYDYSLLSPESLATRRKLLVDNSNFSVGSSKQGFLSSQERADILSKYAKSNAAVAREYFGSEDGKLFNDNIPNDIDDINSEPSSTDIVQTFMPVMIDLIQRCERLEKSPLRRFVDDVFKKNKDKTRIKLERNPKIYSLLRKIFKHL